MPRGPVYSEEELLTEIQRLARRLGRTPTMREMNEQGKHAGRTYQLRFGSWSAAVEAAGLEPNTVDIEMFTERPAACPLCGSEQSGLDFHHWRYGSNKQGCYLCRTCHDAVHDGASTDNPGWLVRAVENLVHRHLKNHPDETDVEYIIERYNLTDVHDLVAAELPEEDH